MSSIRPMPLLISTPKFHIETIHLSPRPSVQISFHILHCTVMNIRSEKYTLERIETVAEPPVTRLGRYRLSINSRNQKEPVDSRLLRRSGSLSGDPVAIVDADGATSWRSDAGVELRWGLRSRSRRHFILFSPRWRTTGTCGIWSLEDRLQLRIY